MIDGRDRGRLVYREGKGRDISHKPCHTGDLSGVGVGGANKIYNMQCTHLPSE